MWKVGKEISKWHKSNTRIMLTKDVIRGFYEQATMLKKCLWKVTKRNFQMAQKQYKKNGDGGPQDR
jgi:hypothetical protein